MPAFRFRDRKGAWHLGEDEICQHSDWRSQRCLAPGAGASFASIPSWIGCSRSDGSEAQEGGSPGQAGTEAAQECQLALLQFALKVRLMKRQRDACCRGISVSVEVDDDLVWRNLEIFNRRIDDPRVGLMHDQKIDILEGVSGGRNDIFATVDDAADGPLEYGFAIHLHVLSTLGQAFGCQRFSGSTPWGAERFRRAFGSESKGENSGHGFRIARGGRLDRLEQGRASTIAEEGIGFDIRGINRPAHDFGTDDQGISGQSVGDKLRADDQSVHESRAGCIDVEGRRDASEFALQNASCRWGHEVLRDGGHEDQIDLFRIDLSPAQAIDGGQIGQVTRGMIVACESSLVNTRPLDDPLAITAQPYQVLVGHDACGGVHPGRGDLNRDLLAESAASTLD